MQADDFITITLGGIGIAEMFSDIRFRVNL